MNTSDLHELNQQTLSIEKEADLEPLISKIKNSKLVCLGDASHGTHEFYEWRMKISLELIRNHGFQFIAFEGDWPDFEDINKSLLGKTEEPIDQLLNESFRRWPSWMWSNREMEEFIYNLRLHNLSIAPERRVRFHGLDLYSIHESAQRIPVILEQLDPALAKQVSNRLSDINQSGNVLKLIEHIKPQETPEKRWLLFDAHQNAKVVRNGLHFTQATGIADDRPWNIRDRHMFETLKSLYNHYGPHSRGIVWAHLNHVSDMRRETGKSTISLGGLAKDSFGDDKVSLVGFLTYSGSVIASPRWEGPVKVITVPPAIPDSIEASLNLISQKRNCSNLLLVFDQKSLKGSLSSPIAYRYIAVVYNPKEERNENYMMGLLPNRFDALLFVDETSALEPLSVLGKSSQTQLNVNL